MGRASSGSVARRTSDPEARTEAADATIVPRHFFAAVWLRARRTLECRPLRPVTLLAPKAAPTLPSRSCELAGSSPSGV
jgi:hypothetical protein